MYDQTFFYDYTMKIIENEKMFHESKTVVVLTLIYGLYILQ